ncbi:MAG TPA: hypothetical protein VL200_05045 [Lacunisphaera sp.]|jgi:hypothetical protein|nr:hypothetical protein [Lacunisphaera sp.]
MILILLSAALGLTLLLVTADINAARALQRVRVVRPHPPERRDLN